MLLHNIKVKVTEDTISDHLCVTTENCDQIMHDHNTFVQFSWNMSSEQDSSEVKTRV